MKKVAIVYDRVNKWGGAERVLLALHELYPDAPLYTSVYDPKKAPWAKVFPKIYTTFLQKIPLIRNFHEILGIFTPIAFESFNFDNYDLVISITSEAAKGLITRPPTKHICYCLTPTRYLWSDYDSYLESPQKPLGYIPFYKIISKPFLRYAKWWDTVASQRPDKMIAISTEVKDRIKKYYKKDSDIIFPPVDLSGFTNKEKETGGKNGDPKDWKNYFLIVSRLVPYKKIDLAINTFNKLSEKLIIIGVGSEEKKLKRLANRNIKFVKNLTDRELAVYYHNTRAFIMPQSEDFGIAAVEAQSFGVPVIAYGSGGAIDTVIHGKTGILFDTQSVEELKKAVIEFDKSRFNKTEIISYAKRFSKEIFKKTLKSYIERL
jgi:glycosyltransferase involved in cell wall biosynthesis